MKAGLAALGLGAAALLVGPRSSAAVGGNERVSVTSSGGQVSGTSKVLDLTPSGQFVVFTSDASELGMDTPAGGIFVRDRLADTTTRIDDTSNGTPVRAEISDDGRYVLAITSGTIRLYDRSASTTTTIGTASSLNLIAISGDGSTIAYTASTGAASLQSTVTGTVTALGTGDVHALSADGRYLVWRSGSNLGITRRDNTNGNSNNVSTDQTTALVAAPRADISADGMSIVYETSANSISGDTDNASDIFLWRSGVTGRTLLSSETGRHFSNPAISSDGTTVSFFSRAAATGVGEPVLRPISGSTEKAGLRPYGGSSATQSWPITRLSSNGRWVAYSSDDDSLITGDTNGTADVFVRDRVGDAASSGAGTVSGRVLRANGNPLSGAVVRISSSTDTYTAFTASDGTYSFAPLPAGRWQVRVSSSGRMGQYYLGSAMETGGAWIFVSDGETVELQDMTLADLDTGPASMVTKSEFLANGASSGGAMSSDGRYVGFTSSASNLVSGDTNGVSDVFVWDRQSGFITRVSVSSSGAQLTAASTGGDISDDGRRVAFATSANGVVATDTDGLPDLFVRNLDTVSNQKATATVSSVLQRPTNGISTRISGNGAVVAYQVGTAFVTARVDGTGTPTLETGVDNVTGLSTDGSVQTRELTGNAQSVSPFGRNVRYGSTNLGVASPAGMSRNGSFVLSSFDGNDVDILDRVNNVGMTYSTRRGTTGWSNGRGLTITFPITFSYDYVKLTSLLASDDGRYIVASGTIAHAGELSDRNNVSDVYFLDRFGALGWQRISIGNDRKELLSGTTAVDMSSDGRFVLVRGAVTKDDTNGVDDLVMIDLSADRGLSSTTGVITGTVTTTSGAPVSNATVKVLNGTERVASTRTSGSGTYRIGGLPAAGYRVKVEDSTNARLGRWAPSASNPASASITNVTSMTTSTVNVTLPLAPAAPAAVTSSRVAPGSMATIRPAVSGNGRFVAYATSSHGLVLKDRIFGTEVRLDAAAAAGTVTEIAISDDAKRVAFVSTSPDLVTGDTNAAADVFVVDPADLVVRRVSRTPVAGQHSGASAAIDISGDGQHVSYVNAGSTYRWDAGPNATTLIDSGAVTSNVPSATALDRDGDTLAYGKAGVVWVLSGTTKQAITGTEGWVHGLSDDGTRLLWSGLGGVVPGAPDSVALYQGNGSTYYSSTFGLFLSDAATGNTEQVDVATGGTESAFGMGQIPGSKMTAQLRGDGKVVVFENAGQSFQNEIDDDVELFVRDVEAGTTRAVGTPGQYFALSSEGKTLVTLRSQELWASTMPGNGTPSSPVISVFGPQGEGVVAIWHSPTEQSAEAPTEVVYERYQNGGTTPVETVVKPYDPAYGIHITPTVPPGSTQRVEIRFRNSQGDSPPTVSDTISMDNNATVNVTVQDAAGPVAYAAVIVQDSLDRPVTFAPTKADGTTVLTVAPGTYRLRAYPPDGSSNLEGWSGGGPLASTGLLTVAAGSNPSVTIDAPHPGTLTPVSQTAADGLLNAGTSTQADLSPDGGYVGLTTGSTFIAGTVQTNRAAFVRNLSNGKIFAPCELLGGTEGGTSQIAVSNQAAYIATVSYDGKVVRHCNRATGEWTSISTAPGSVVADSLRISDDGSVVAFSNTQAYLVSPDGTAPDVFAWRPGTNDVRRLTIDTGSTATVTGITGDGSKVSVLTNQVLSSSDTFSDTSLYLVNTLTGAATLASPHPIGGSAHAMAGAVSRDGTSVVFISKVATLAGSKTGQVRAYRYRPSTNTVVAASGNGAGKAHIGDISAVAISGDGQRVAYTINSPTSLEVRGDDAAVTGAYVYDVSTGALAQLDIAANQPRNSLSGASAIDLDATGDAAVVISADVLLPHETDNQSADTFYWTRAPRPAYTPQILDGVPPVMRAPSVIVGVAPPGQGAGPVSWDPASITALDAVDGPLPVTCQWEPAWYPVGTTTNRCTAIDSSGNGTAVEIQVRVVTQAATAFAGGATSCAVLADGTVACAGSNTGGQLGRGTTGSGTFAAGAVPGQTNVTKVASGDDSHVCALSPSRGVWCWGANTVGQVGNNTTSASVSSPANAFGLDGGVASISVGGANTCAVLTGGTVRCWGLNANGQVGNGNRTNQSTPQLVTGLSGVAEVATSATHSCARLTNGTVSCWGSNANHQLGTTAVADSPTPLAVAGLTNVVDITVGQGSSCAVLDDGTARCWGANAKGQLGNGTTTQAASPVLVSGLSGAVEVHAYGTTTCARRGDGTVACWGDNTSWALGGDTTAATSSVPVAVAALSDATALAEGSRPCFLVSTGAVRCNRVDVASLTYRGPYAGWIPFL